MWNVFGRIYDKLENNDLLYFDLTHAFRYLPMLVLVLGQYARHLKKVTIKSVTYGNYEARGGNSDVAPIADLMPLVTLLDYTQAAANFGEYGRVSKLLFSFKGADFDNLAKQLKRFEQDVATCRGRELMNGKTVASAKNRWLRLWLLTRQLSLSRNCCAAFRKSWSHLRRENVSKTCVAW